MWHFPDGYYDDNGEWQRTKFCFVACQHCTCMPPGGRFYSEAHDKRRNAMTTKVTVKNDNQGAPYSDWDVELILPDGTIEKTLKPGESAEVYLWHDGKALGVREVPKATT